MVATTEPQRVVAGDTAQWQKDFSDYPASAGWALSYTLINAAKKITINGGQVVASGSGFIVTALPAATTTWDAGKYKYQGVVTKGTDRFTVVTGDMEVVANFASATTLDARTHARKTLDAIEAVIENRASKDQEQYSIGDRMLRRTPLADLYKLRAQYRALVATEEALDNKGTGKPSRRRSLIRMP